MPSFTSIPQRPIKMLYLGHTGAGKTGSLCSLMAAGYHVRLLDLDGGIDIIGDYLTNPVSPYLKPHPKGLWTSETLTGMVENCSFVTVSENYTLRGVKAIPKADAWPRLNGQLNNWKDEGRNFGNLATWGPECILVIDGLSRLCEAAMHFQLSLGGRLEKGPQVGSTGDNDFTHAYRYITDFLDLLKSDEIKCHVIMICHIQFMAEMQSDAKNPNALREQKGFPQTVGRLISPKIGQYFNHTLRAKTEGTGSSTRRVIVTNNDENIELKNAAPLRVQQKYDLSDGLAAYFRDVRGGVK